MSGLAKERIRCDFCERGGNNGNVCPDCADDSRPRDETGPDATAARRAGSAEAFKEAARFAVAKQGAAADEWAEGYNAALRFMAKRMLARAEEVERE